MSKKRARTHSSKRSKVVHPRSERIDPKVTSIDYRAAWRGVLAVILTLPGVGVSLYLSYFHLTLLVGEVHGGGLCGFGNGIGCHAVLLSRYGRLLGVPLSLWGAFFYSAIVILALGGIILRRNRGRAFHVFAFYLTSLAIAFDVYLLYIMIMRLDVICPLCVSTYVVNLGLFLVLFGAVRRQAQPAPSLLSMFPRLRATAGPGQVAFYENAVKGLLFGAVVLCFIFIYGGSSVLTHAIMSSDTAMVENILEQLARQEPREINTSGRPALGSGEGPVTIVEYSDFRCAFCRKAASYIKIASAANQDTARFIFRHMPLDSACNEHIRRNNPHPGACKLAEGAVCANEQGKFWEYHDLAFESEGRVNRALLNTLADEVGLNLSEFRSCLDSGRGEEVVREDIREGTAAGVNSTPTLFVNGRILRGVYKPSVLEQIIQHTLDMPAAPETVPALSPAAKPAAAPRGPAPARIL